MVLPLSVCRRISWPAHRPVPTGGGSVADGWSGRKSHLGRGLCDGDDRRGGEAEAYPPALYRGLLSWHELDALARSPLRHRTWTLSKDEFDFTAQGVTD